MGSEIPEFNDLVEIWEDFSHEIVKERYFPVLEKIFNNYKKILDRTPSEIFQKNLRIFGIRFTHNSNKIEGSNLTLRDVKAVIDNGVLPHNKPVNDVIEARAHMKVYEDMINCTEKLSMNLICKWHKELFQMTNHIIAGNIRGYPVGIEGSSYTPPMTKFEIEELLDALFKWYNKKKDILLPVFVASIMHYRFIAIHPFGDGNGRITRLITNYILFKSGYPMFDIDPKIRNQYYTALENADKKEDNELPFILWFVKNYLKANKTYQ